MLKSLRLMLGRFTDIQKDAARSEWNVHCDPAAAGVVYETVAPDHTSLGLDVTTQVVMDSDEVREHFQHPLLQPVLEMSAVWFDERAQLNFHDPLAAVTLFDDSICEFENGIVTVTRHDGRDDGVTEWTPNATGPHRIGVKVDPTRFFNSYFGVFK
jgi:purine nucleosidase